MLRSKITFINILENVEIFHQVKAGTRTFYKIQKYFHKIMQNQKIAYKFKYSLVMTFCKFVFVSEGKCIENNVSMFPECKKPIIGIRLIFSLCTTEGDFST